MCIKIVFSCDFNRYRAQTLEPYITVSFAPLSGTRTSTSSCTRGAREEEKTRVKIIPKLKQIMPVMIDEYLVVGMFQRFTECIVCLSLADVPRRADVDEAPLALIEESHPIVCVKE